MVIRSSRELGLVLRSLREDGGLTRERLAQLAGVSVRWLANFETGKPTVDLSRVMDCYQALGYGFELKQLPQVTHD